MADDNSYTHFIGIDHLKGWMVKVSVDHLIEILGQGNSIAKSFDQIYGEHLNKISTEYSKNQVHFILKKSELEGKPIDSDDPQGTAIALLINAETTLIAALDCLRHSYILQTGMLLRIALEAIALALHLRANPEDCIRYRNGEMKTSKTINTLKQYVGPVFGQIYGMLSEDFVHIGKKHRRLYPIKEYIDDNNSTVNTLLYFTKVSYTLLSIVVELFALPWVEKPRFWKIDGNNVNFHIPPDEKERLQDFEYVPNTVLPSTQTR